MVSPLVKVIFLAPLAKNPERISGPLVSRRIPAQEMNQVSGCNLCTNDNMYLVHKLMHNSPT
jgi:hypothetical protein